MIFVALGANLPSQFGSPFETLHAAKKAMQRREITIIAESQTWLTAPVPVSDQPWYHNEVVRIETALSPYELLEVLQEIEEEFGRVRTVRNAPRVLDLDLIAYDREILNKPALIVPHPRMHKRAFVLLPMREVAENWEHPVMGVSLNDLIMNLPQDQQAVPMEEAAV
ncbi:MAG: 2-amino-4-hydroxy-6-hydroxymethyldihydropteridine diphosphokinase [Rhodospirillales bacterium]|nr:2-amino-4-hydroxy-6-hydroxymethyldihydropteridine diphosphokinase [Rhodospirillales bacterium]MCB9995486.1 2-amino-4-hydroxy-6-hydroxymethyldihydropteridine diphosphokinase [Rhodospirillales bacterium]